MARLSPAKTRFRSAQRTSQALKDMVERQQRESASCLIQCGQQIDDWYGEGNWPDGFDVARELGMGWKISPNIMIAPGETAEFGRINGSGAIQHIWIMTGGGSQRLEILRMCWDDEEQPSVECPLGDFFATGMGEL